MHDRTFSGAAPKTADNRRLRCAASTALLQVGVGAVADPSSLVLRRPLRAAGREGVADVTTHLIDLVFWQCFPRFRSLHESDVEVLSASHWPPAVQPEDFRLSTGTEPFPPYLEKYLRDGVLEVMANGRMLFRVRGACRHGGGLELEFSNGEDAFSAVMRGSRAAIEVVQDETTGNVKSLFVCAAEGVDPAQTEAALGNVLPPCRQSTPELRVVKTGSPGLFLVDLPVAERPGHEVHFGMVAERFLRRHPFGRNACLGGGQYAGEILHHDDGRGTGPHGAVGGIGEGPMEGRC